MAWASIGIISLTAPSPYSLCFSHTELFSVFFFLNTLFFPDTKTFLSYYTLFILITPTDEQLLIVLCVLAENSSPLEVLVAVSRRLMSPPISSHSYPLSSVILISYAMFKSCPYVLQVSCEGGGCGCHVLHFILEHLT